MNVGITHRHSVACRSDEQKGETKQNRDSSFCRFVYTTQLYVRPFILRSYSCALLNVLIFWALSSKYLFYLIILNFCLIELIKIKFEKSSGSKTHNKKEESRVLSSQRDYSGKCLFIPHYHLDSIDSLSNSKRTIKK